MPPLTVTVPEPLEFPQVAGVNVDVKVNDVGWVTVILWLMEHPLPSVCITVYVPAATLFIVANVLEPKVGHK